MEITMNRTKRVLVGLFAAATVCGSASSAEATAFPAQGSPTTVGRNGCNVVLTHGNAFGGAYGKAKITPSLGGCGSNSWIQVTGWSGGYVLGAQCSFSSSGPCVIESTGTYYVVQSFAPYSNLLATVINFCDATNSTCTQVAYSGI